MKEFADKGFKTLGEYLRYYLSKDVLILLRALTLHVDSFFTLLKVHPLGEKSAIFCCPPLPTSSSFSYFLQDSEKLTVGGVSFVAMHRYLAANRRVAMFMPLQAALYNHLRQGSQGGITQVHRSEATRSEHDSPINAHLAEEIKNLEQKLTPAKDPLGCCDPGHERTCVHNVYKAAAAAGAGPPPSIDVPVGKNKGRVLVYDDVHRCAPRKSRPIQQSQTFLSFSPFLSLSLSPPRRLYVSLRRYPPSSDVFSALLPRRRRRLIAPQSISSGT